MHEQVFTPKYVTDTSISGIMTSIIFRDIYAGRKSRTNVV